MREAKRGLFGIYGAGKILLGLLVFLVLVTFPIWFTAFGGAGFETVKDKLARAVERGRGEHACVEAPAYMRAWHMDLLNRWRDEVVREGKRIYISSDGTEHEMSLSMTCMRCHNSKKNFCDKCHNYVGLSLYCWDCHVDPTGE